MRFTPKSKYFFKDLNKITRVGTIGKKEGSIMSKAYDASGKLITDH